MWLSLFLACSRSPDAPPAAPPPAATAAATASSAVPAPAALAPAPSRDVYGLTMGVSTGADIEAWLKARGLACPGAPSPRRTTYRYACDGDLPAAALPGRDVKGKLTGLLVVRGDTTPMTHFSTVRKYSLPADAVADYLQDVAALQATLGAPTRAGTVPDATKFTGKVAHYASEWRFADLGVRVVLLKAGAETISLSETWDLPGAEATEVARPAPSGAPHGPHP